jgi:hypothetical protein
MPDEQVENLAWNVASTFLYDKGANPEDCWKVEPNAMDFMMQWIVNRTSLWKAYVERGVVESASPLKSI